MAEPGPRARQVEALGLALLLALAGWFYFWTATSAGSPLTSGLAPDDLYNRLADGFLAGRTSFAEEAPPELAKLANPYDPAQNAPYKKYHDVSYYRGRYYLYFGPTPVLVLLAPWKLLTGSYLPQNLAVAVFAWGSGLLGIWLLRGLRDRHWPAVPAWVLWAAAAAALFGNMLPVLLRRPLYYELAIASACFFGLAALGSLFQSQGKTGRGRMAWLVGAGVCLGLAVGARPDYLFGTAGLLAAWLWLEWKKRRPAAAADWLHWGATVMPTVVALGFVGLLLAAYNYARFDNFLEFGMRYQFAGGSQTQLKFMSPWFLAPNLYYYLLAPPHLTGYFPFIQVTGPLPFTTPASYTGQENMYGMLFALPWLLALGWLRRVVRRGEEIGAAALREFALLGGGLIAGIAGFLVLIAGANNRYLVDFVPAATVLAGLGVLAWENGARGWRRWLGRVAWLAALAWTLAFNLLVSLQHNGLLRYHNPAGYARLAGAANALVEPLTRAGGRSGPLRIDFTLPPERTGKLEPLVVTGWSFQADFLYVFYKDESHIQIGFEHTSYGGPMSPPLRVDFNVPHVLEVEMGSLYPPREHPYWAGRPAGEFDRLKHTLRVRLDGQVVHEGRFDFYDAAPGDVSVGRNHVSEAFGRKFTGVIRGVTRGAPRN